MTIENTFPQIPHFLGGKEEKLSILDKVLMLSFSALLLFYEEILRYMLSKLFSLPFSIHLSQPFSILT